MSKMHFPLTGVNIELKKLQKQREHRNHGDASEEFAKHLLMAAEGIERGKHFAAVGDSLPSMSKRRGFVRPFAKFIGKIFLRISQMFLRDQRIYNQSLLDSTYNLLELSILQEREINNLKKSINEQLEETRNFKEKINDVIEEKLNEINPVIRTVHNNKNKIEALLSQNIEERLHYMEEKISWENSGDEELFNSLYVRFEDVFRGNRDLILDRLDVYTQLLRDRGYHFDELSFVDIGCGRGEWMELVKKSGGVNILGIDINKDMVDYTRNIGLSAECADFFEYASSIESESIDIITGFHIIEHLSYKKQVSLLKEIHRLLKPKGMFILESPNPHNLTVSASTFYTDPTHIRPVYPETMKFFAQEIGFSSVDLLYLHPKEDVLPEHQMNNDYLNHVLFGPQDFAVMGWKS